MGPRQGYLPGGITLQPSINILFQYIFQMAVMVHVGLRIRCLYCIGRNGVKEDLNETESPAAECWPADFSKMSLPRIAFLFRLIPSYDAGPAISSPGLACPALVL